MRRYPELDLLRGIAILLMVIYHSAFDLQIFYGWDLALFTTPWGMVNRIIQFLFLTLVGISASLSYARSHTKPLAVQWKKHVIRFARIGSIAMLITIATYFMNPNLYIRFGILHLIATSALILPLFAPLKKYAVIPGIVFVVIGQLIATAYVHTWLLLPLGLRPAEFQSWDYFPLLPWFGIILIGYGVGHLLYVDEALRVTRYASQSNNSQNYYAHLLTWPGQHALLIYAIHQPIILVMLWLMLGKPTF